MNKLALIFTLFISGFLCGGTITRDNVINNAETYININNWSTSKDSVIIEGYGKWKSYYVKNTDHNRVPYCYGGFKSESSFNMGMSNCTGGVGTKAIYDLIGTDKIRDSIWGIDCAGFVLKCWEVGYYSGWRQCETLGIKVDSSSVKKGDWLSIPEHQLLCEKKISDDSEDSIYYDLFESTSSENGENTYPGVQHNLGKGLNIFLLDCYSIFPQFSECTPKDGSIISVKSEENIEMGVTVRCKGAITQSGTVIKLNGDEEKIFYIDEINDILILLTIQSV